MQAMQPTRPSMSPKSNRPMRQLRPSFGNPANVVDNILLRTFISSCVQQLGDVSNGPLLMLRSLIPVVTDCLISVARSLQQGKSGGDGSNMNILLAQSLFRKNPLFRKQNYLQETITQLINEEIVALQVRNKHNRFKEHSPIIYELFHNYDHDGDSYITLDEVKSLLHDVGGILDFTVLEAHKLIKMLDFHDTGMIDFHDFNTGMKRLFEEEKLKSALNYVMLEKEDPHDVHLKMMSHREEFLLEHAEKKLMHMLKKKDYNFRSLFNQLDRNQDNSISMHELANALRGLSTELNETVSKVGNSIANQAFTDETVALLLSKERIDEDGDHCVDFLEFKKFCAQLLKHHGVAIARRASLQATHAARVNVWESAKHSLLRTEKYYNTLTRIFIETEERSKDIDPNEETLLKVTQCNKTARESLNFAKDLVEQASVNIGPGFDDNTYRSLMELAVVSEAARLRAKTAVRNYSKAVLKALQLHEQLLEANHEIGLHYDRFSIMKTTARDFVYRWSKTNRSYTNEHTRHTMASLEAHLSTSVKLKTSIPPHLVSEVDLASMKKFVQSIDTLEQVVSLAGSEVEDSSILEQADIALEASLRSGSLDAFGRSLVAAICRSAPPQNLFTAMFLQTSEKKAICVACGSQNVQSVFKKNKSVPSDSGSMVMVGTTSISGDAFGFDCLRGGQQHKKNHFMLPLSIDHETHAFAYLYIEKESSKPLSPRLARFIKTLTSISSARMAKLEQIDRLVRLVKIATKTLTDVANASTFIGLRIGSTGIRFLEGSKKFEEMVTHVSFIKAANARTLMAASESNVEPRSARCKGPCLAWRAGETLHNVSVVVGVADMTTTAHHTNIFRATQTTAKALACSPHWHLGTEVEKMFEQTYNKLVCSTSM